MNENKERKLFELWYEADSYPLEHTNWFRVDSDNDYVYDCVADSWHGWKGRASTAVWQERATKLLDVFKDYDKSGINYRLD